MSQFRPVEETESGNNDKVIVESFLTFAVKTPSRYCKRLRSNLHHDLQYGPPFEENELLEKAFLQEVSYKNVSLLSVHECLAAKIDPNIKHGRDKNNNRPLHYAAKHGNVTLAKMLLRAGADVCLANSLGETPLMISSSGSRTSDADFAELILSYHDGQLPEKTNDNDDEACPVGDDLDDFVDRIDRGGGSALSRAVRSSNRWTVHALLVRGARVTNACVAEAKRVRAEAIGGSERSGGRSTTTIKSSKERRRGYRRREPPSLTDRVLRRKEHPSRVIVEMMERASEGDYDEHFYTRKKSRSESLFQNGWWAQFVLDKLYRI